ncbi:MAG: DNA polymerase I [Abitibacteriaceae bacterium]|nr:DNA polymerase I [Abditibacteriaceae bacterium]
MKLLLVDGYSLLYRAFFSSPPLTTQDGQPTGALFGFIKMVFRLLDEARPEYALVALDASGPTFRHDSFAAYKANRTAAPDDFKSQTKLARRLLDGLFIPHYEHEGFEADDILGTLARIGAESDIDVTIVTGDGDALQLVNGKVSVMLTRRGVTDLECYTPDAVKARFGFPPLLLPDYKGLRGDSSDNIPGVPGIGEKTGMSLIGKFGTLEKLYEKLDEVTPPRIRDLLTEHREAAFHSRDLARIVVDLPLNIDFEACRYAVELDPEKRAAALATVRAFEFKSLLSRYQERNAGSISDGVEAAEAVTERSEFSCATHKTNSGTEALAWLKQHSKGRDSAIALLLDDEPGAVFAVANEALYFQGDLSGVREWLEDTSMHKVVHDAKAIQLALDRRGLKLSGIVADALLMSYLLEPQRQHHPISLLVEKYLNQQLPTPQVAAPAKSAKKKKTKAGEPADGAASLFNEETGDATTSSATDGKDWTEAQRVLTVSGAALAAVQPVLRTKLEEIGEWTLFNELELPLVKILVMMEENGMLLDVQQLRELGQKLEADATRLERSIWELAGEEFNIGSTKQLQTILYEKIGLDKGRATKTGHSTDVHTLEKFAEKHEIVRKILEYRGTTKLKVTYVDALLSSMNPQTHRIHTNLNQTGAVSGRLSSSNPNLQNIPIRTEQGRIIRKAFIAPPGHVLLSADYSQIELRLLAHITGDKPLVQAFSSGEDVHARTAADLFGVPVEAVDSDMRRKAKMTNYAIAYGVSGFGLAKQLGTGSAGEAQEFINRYFETLPGVKRYIDDTLRTARDLGYVETLMGRRRPVPDIRTARHQERAAAERTAINHPIQGTAADAMKLAMLAIAHEMRERAVASRMLMQVHDELVFEVPEHEISLMSELVPRLMRDVPTKKLGLRVPLEVDLGVGTNWNETKDHNSSPATADADVEDELSVEV